MSFDFQAISMHSKWHADTGLTIYCKPALDDMDDFTVMRNGYSPGSFH